jgi:hypothetical protein
MSHRGMTLQTSVFGTDIGVMNFPRDVLYYPAMHVSQFNVHYCGDFYALTAVRHMTVSNASSQREAVSLRWRARGLVVPARQGNV